jgi:hypothetical protein
MTTHPSPFQFDKRLTAEEEKIVTEVNDQIERLLKEFEKGLQRRYGARFMDRVDWEVVVTACLCMASAWLATHVCIEERAEVDAGVKQLFNDLITQRREAVDKFIKTKTARPPKDPRWGPVTGFSFERRRRH